MKSNERSKLGRDGELVINITNSHQLCPRQGRKFMGNGSNKTNLLNFLISEGSEKEVYAEKIKDCYYNLDHSWRQLYQTHLLSCINLVEAVTRIFLHAYHASRNGHQCIAIRSSDRDVEVSACHHQASIPADIVLISGMKSSTRIISI